MTDRREGLLRRFVCLQALSDPPVSPPPSPRGTPPTRPESPEESGIFHRNPGTGGVSGGCPVVPDTRRETTPPTDTCLTDIYRTSSVTRVRACTRGSPLTWRSMTLCFSFLVVRLGVRGPGTLLVLQTTVSHPTTGRGGGSGRCGRSVFSTCNLHTAKDLV